MIALNQIEVNTAKKPSLSKTGVQPPYLECMEASQLVYARRVGGQPCGRLHQQGPDQ